MREIKFRAWDGKEMLYRGLHDKNWYYTPYNDENGCNIAFAARQSDAFNFEVMQHTGLKDKNGVDIYEDDIVKQTDESPEEDYIGPIKYYGGAYYIDNRSESECINWDEVEVLGNIHQNPELLNQQDLNKGE